MSHIDDASTLRAIWWKSSASGTQSDCVEFAIVAPATIAVRDSKHPTGPALLFSRKQIGGLVTAARNGELGAE